MTAPTTSSLSAPHSTPIRSHQPHRPPPKRHHTAPELDTLGLPAEPISRFHAMSKDTLHTHGLFESAPLPFVLDDGVLSFYTQADSPQQSGRPEHGASLPTSAISPSSDFNGTPHDTSVLQDLSIWRAGDDGLPHIYAQMLNQHPMRETSFLGQLQTSLMCHGPVHAAMVNLPCQFMHLNIPLEAPPAACNKTTNHSMVTISLPRRNPVRLLTSLYSQGVLVSSYEVQMEKRSHLSSEATLHSAPLPQELIDGLCKELGPSDKKGLTLDGVSSGTDFLDCVAVLRFVQQEDSATDGEEPVLIAAAEFHAVQDSSPVAVKISSLTLEDDLSQKPYLPKGFLLTPPPSRGKLTDLATSSEVPHHPRSLGRPIPKLSVSIPTPSMHGVSGIQLYTDSPESAVRHTPLTGIPSNVTPMTPFDQLIHTPLSPPQISQSSTRSSFSQAYPFTLLSTSPGSPPSPAIGVLDSGSGAGSAPAWLTFPRNTMPFNTPSFFPHSASAFNSMSSLAQRTLDAGTPTSLHGRDDEYIGDPLASPMSITSTTHFSVLQDAAAQQPI